MQLQGAVVVVTGGGSGIGAALVERIAAEVPGGGRRGGPTTDEALPQRVAEPGSRRIGRGSPSDGLARRVRRRPTRCRSEESLVGPGREVRPERPDRSVLRERRHRLGQGHRRAGRGLAARDGRERHVARVRSPGAGPRMVERGRGHLLVTASAAGLLSNLGDAPYSVSKHAAVALAEWISITYGDRGVGVSCLCPQGVRTPLLFGERADGRRQRRRRWPQPRS